MAAFFFESPRGKENGVERQQQSSPGGVRARLRAGCAPASFPVGEAFFSLP
jgi:hypothetical protein